MQAGRAPVEFDDARLSLLFELLDKSPLFLVRFTCRGPVLGLGFPLLD